MFAALSFGVQAEDTPAKNYGEMTLEELQGIDQKSLDKKQKNALKKALSKAKKAERTRIKAEKAQRRAEEKRRKKEALVEKKRIKAEEKARKKHNKRIQKQLDLIENTYTKTRISGDEFEAYITVSGPYTTNERALFGVNDDTVDNRHRLTGFYYPNQPKLIIRLSVSNRVSVSELTSLNTDPSSGSPMKYMNYNNYWRNFSRATLRGGKLRSLVPSRKHLDRCSTLACNFREDFSIDLNTEDIVDALKTSGTLKLKISNASGRSYIEHVSAAYMLGFLERLGEVSSEGAELSKVVGVIVQQIRDKLQ